LATKHRVLDKVSLFLALGACALAAWSATLIRWNSPARQIVPFAVLSVILLLGFIFGRKVGIIGSIIAAAIFAYGMYQPLGSLRVADQGARSALAWMLLAGVTLSYLLLPTRGSRSGH
jgi:K+-sensing histidine kinase KdpD